VKTLVSQWKIIDDDGKRPFSFVSFSCESCHTKFKIFIYAHVKRGGRLNQFVPELSSQIISRRKNARTTGNNQINSPHVLEKARLLRIVRAMLYYPWLTSVSRAHKNGTLSPKKIDAGRQLTGMSISISLAHENRHRKDGSRDHVWVDDSCVADAGKVIHEIGFLEAATIQKK
jgi:hypothetical protein